MTVLVGMSEWPKKVAMWEAVGEVMGADKIEYEDLGKGEVYIVHINGGIIRFNVSGNQYDGGYMSCSVVKGPKEKPLTRMQRLREHD